MTNFPCVEFEYELGLIVDLSVEKNLRRTESQLLQLRLEAFNHAQFYGPSSVDGNISSPTFGNIVSAAAPRLLQVAIKVLF